MAGIYLGGRSESTSRFHVETRYGAPLNIYIKPIIKNEYDYISMTVGVSDITHISSISWDRGRCTHQTRLLITIKWDLLL